MATYNHFYALPVYQTGRSFRKEISTVVKKYFPKTGKYHLKSQVLDASRSITANIAEGFGRCHHQENIRFSGNSGGSLDETLDHMITAHDEKYITKEILSDINKDYKERSKQLNTYIEYLKTAKRGSGNN